MPGEASIKGFNTITRGFGVRLGKDEEGTPYVPGKHGKVEWHSWDNETLAIYSEMSRTKGRLIRHLKCRIWQQREWEVHVLVAREDIVEVADLINPFKKKQNFAINREKLL